MSVTGTFQQKPILKAQKAGHVKCLMTGQNKRNPIPTAVEPDLMRRMRSLAASCFAADLLGAEPCPT